MIFLGMDYTDFTDLFSLKSLLIISLRYNHEKKKRAVKSV